MGKELKGDLFFGTVIGTTVYVFLKFLPDSPLWVFALVCGGCGLLAGQLRDLFFK